MHGDRVRVRARPSQKGLEGRVDAVIERMVRFVGELTEHRGYAAPVDPEEVLNLLASFDSWSHGLVMVQAEVADRLAAGPGSKTYGVPSVKVAWYAAANRVGTVSPTVFWPVPNVESGLVALKRRPQPETTATRDQVFAVVDAAFAQRRKMLRSALAGLAGSPTLASAAVVAAGLDPKARGETLDVTDFAGITEQIFLP